MTNTDSSKYNPSETRECCNEFGHAFSELTHFVSCAENQNLEFGCYYLMLLLENKLEELSMRIGIDSGLGLHGEPIGGAIVPRDN